MLLFLVTPCLAVAVKNCTESIPIKKKCFSLILHKPFNLENTNMIKPYKATDSKELIFLMFLKFIRCFIIAIRFYQEDSNYYVSDSVSLYKIQWKWVYISDWLRLVDLDNIVSVFVIVTFESPLPWPWAQLSTTTRNLAFRSLKFCSLLTETQFVFFHSISFATSLQFAMPIFSFPCPMSPSSW